MDEQLATTQPEAVIAEQFAARMVAAIRSANEYAEKTYFGESERVCARLDFMAGWDARSLGETATSTAASAYILETYNSVADWIDGAKDFKAGWEAFEKWTAEKK